MMLKAQDLDNPVLRWTLVTAFVDCLNKVFFSTSFTTDRLQTRSSQNCHRKLYSDIEQICTLTKSWSALLMFGLKASSASHHCLVKEHMAQQLVALPAFQNHFPWERRCIIHHGCWFSWGGGGALLHHNRGGWGEGSCGSQAVWTGQTFTVHLPCLPLWPKLLLDD